MLAYTDSCTNAGTGEYGFSGDGGPAVNAQLRRPGGVAVDGAGNIFFNDQLENRIRKVDATGTITTIAGTGEYGFSGAGGPAVNAQLRRPSGVAVDGDANVYIADSNNQRIRKVDSTGTISTVAGRGGIGFGGDGGPATQAQLNYPSGVAVGGAGNLFIADRGNHRIRKVDAAGTIPTVAGTGESGFTGRRRPGGPGCFVLPPWFGGGRRGQCLHRRYGQPPRSQADAGRQLNASESNRPGPHARTTSQLPPGPG